MAGKQIRIPFTSKTISGHDALEVLLLLQLRTPGGAFAESRFKFDPGTHLTTISIEEAERLGIVFDRSRRVTVHGTTGVGVSYLGPLSFSYPDLPEYQFETLCCFTPTPLKRGLLSLADVVNHFTMRSVLPTSLHPLGALVLRLHSKHRGQPRP